ncbi:MAG: hypothetical protein LBT55_04220 [Clostridiaceae bacterium]|jgi:hypothetical protein|nr:hypothetical protein [Clostridiaceae bacterium]
MKKRKLFITTAILALVLILALALTACTGGEVTGEITNSEDWNKALDATVAALTAAEPNYSMTMEMVEDGYIVGVDIKVAGKSASGLMTETSGGKETISEKFIVIGGETKNDGYTWDEDVQKWEYEELSEIEADEMLDSVNGDLYGYTEFFDLIKDRYEFFDYSVERAEYVINLERVRASQEDSEDFEDVPEDADMSISFRNGKVTKIALSSDSERAGVAIYFTFGGITVQAPADKDVIYPTENKKGDALANSAAWNAAINATRAEINAEDGNYSLVMSMTASGPVSIDAEIRVDGNSYYGYAKTVYASTVAEDKFMIIDNEDGTFDVYLWDFDQEKWLYSTIDEDDEFFDEDPLANIAIAYESLCDAMLNKYSSFDFDPETGAYVVKPGSAAATVGTGGHAELYFKNGRLIELSMDGSGSIVFMEFGFGDIEITAPDAEDVISA